MRTDLRLLDVLKIEKLPCKSTLNNYDLRVFTLGFLSKFNKYLIDAWVKKPIDFLGLSEKEYKGILIEFSHDTNNNQRYL